jgi:DNA adenine methylase
MAVTLSPLRYPGGKQILSRVLAHLIRLNGREEGVYAEPYAGGAGAALNLLFGEHVERIMINDLDPCIYAFWDAVLNRTDEFLELLHETPATMREWCRQRDVYRRRHRRRRLPLGFATFFLNRCNRSGIIVNGGPIGGRKQRGKWKIDARYNRQELARRIERIALYRDRISLFNLDAVDFLRKHVLPIANKAFAYLDPPYFTKGSDLYLRFHRLAEHARLATFIRRQVRLRWVMSYDNVPEIRDLYAGFRQVPFDLSYSARTRRIGSELLIARKDLVFPREWQSSIPSEYISNAA